MAHRKLTEHEIKVAKEEYVEWTLGHFPNIKTKQDLTIRLNKIFHSNRSIVEMMAICES